MNTKLSRTALFVCLILLMALSACGAGAPAATPTVANTNTPAPPTITPTITATSTHTPVPTKTQTPTVTPNLAATQQYEGFLAWVQRFVDEGFIPSTNGEYFALDDYSDSLAKSGYYRWTTNDAAEPTNFIIQAKVKIDNASTENVFKAGCGFVFLDPFSNHAVFFSLDGNANYRTNGGDRGSNYLDATLLQNPEGVTMTLLLYNKALRFYINDRLALSGITVYGEAFSVGPSVLSGTSEGFGTRCDFTEMTLWTMDQ